jgi:hypothetical protein
MKLLESYKQKHDTEVPKSDNIAGVDKAQRQALQLNYTTFSGIDLSCLFRFCFSYFKIMLLQIMLLQIAAYIIILCRVQNLDVVKNKLAFWVSRSVEMSEQCAVVTARM